MIPGDIAIFAIIGLLICAGLFGIGVYAGKG